MALNLSFNIKELYDIFCKEIATKIPTNFNSIPAIADLEKEGYILKKIHDIGGNLYKPDEMQRFFSEYLLPWGKKEIAEDFYIHEEVYFVFEKNKQKYDLRTDLILDRTTLRLSYDPTEKLKLKTTSKKDN